MIVKSRDYICTCISFPVSESLQIFRSCDARQRASCGNKTLLKIYLLSISSLHLMHASVHVIIFKLLLTLQSLENAQPGNVLSHLCRTVKSRAKGRSEFPS